jgi:hypothetical protein
LLPSLNQKAGTPLQVGEMQHDIVGVPNLQTIRTTTLERLESFQKAGGTLIFLGDIPTLVDANPSGRAERLAESARIALDKP